MTPWNSLVLCLLFSTVYCVIITDADVFVSTKNGVVRGTRREKSLQYLGIPFAKPPVGDLRWRPPEVADSWKPNYYNATSIPAACPQKYCTKYLPEVGCPDIMSEDCLYLNVWTPMNASLRTRYPVMVYFHGGAFKWGHASSEVYDGQEIASSGDVVLVVTNYRLGLFGFLYTGEGVNDAQGNYGIMDQRLALQWVQDNIVGFGGDPNMVTIFGQSAGGQSVDIHLLSPLSQGLFHRAIIQSAPLDVPYRTKTEALGVTRSVKLLLNCAFGDISCLRSKSVDQIEEAQEQSFYTLTSTEIINFFEPIGPIVDEINVKFQPIEGARAEKYNTVPLMIGSVTEEVRYFVYGALKTLPLPFSLYEIAIGILRPDHFFEISAKYAPPFGQFDQRDLLSQLGTDYMFICATRNVSRTITKSQDNNGVYLYIFDHVTESPGELGSKNDCGGHVCHSAEIPYVFGNTNVQNLTSTEKILSKSMVSYWTNFAHSGDPNSGPSFPNVKWPVYDSSKDSTMIFNTPDNKIVRDYRADYCDFWDSMNYDN